MPQELPQPSEDEPPPSEAKVWEKKPPDNMNWISPGKITVSNFYPGARAEYPITVHNGGQKLDTKLVITEIGETSCPIALDFLLYRGKASEVYGISSNEPMDRPHATKYMETGNIVIVEGLQPNTTRKLYISYGTSESATFSIYYREPDHVPSGTSKAPAEAQGWVMIVDPTPVLQPRETRDILVILELPESVIVTDPKWEFWVAVTDITAGGSVKTELCARWIVNMR